MRQGKQIRERQVPVEKRSENAGKKEVKIWRCTLQILDRI